MRKMMGRKTSRFPYKRRYQHSHAQMAGWLLAIGPIPEKFRADEREKYVQDHNVWDYVRMRAWAERHLYEAGIIKKIDDQRWHRKALDFCDWIVNTTIEQRRKGREQSK